jgi:hypothetical protein
MIAQQITPRVQRWLRNSRSARVLHLFNEVSTLTNDRSEVIALVSPEVGPGPFSAVIEGDFTSGLDVNLPVAFDSTRQSLTVGSLVVDFRESAVWQPKPVWSRLQGTAIDTWPSADDLPADIDQYLKLAIEGIIVDDSSTYLAGVKGLVGRGNGLTPTGDDVLIGVQYGLWVWHPHRLHRPRREWMGMILKKAISRTTTLSANFIRAAASGEATWQWHDLANGCPHAAERILSIGHTSGSDAWAGFIYTGSALRPAMRHNAWIT